MRGKGKRKLIVLDDSEHSELAKRRQGQHTASRGLNVSKDSGISSSSSSRLHQSSLTRNFDFEVKRAKESAKVPTKLQNIRHRLAEKVGGYARPSKATKSSYSVRPAVVVGGGSIASSKGGATRKGVATGGALNVILKDEVAAQVIGEIFKRTTHKSVELPVSFTTYRDYLECYRPLLLEEARASLISNWEEECENRNVYEGVLTAAMYQKYGSKLVEMEYLQHHVRRKDFVTGDVLVLMDRNQRPCGACYAGRIKSLKRSDARGNGNNDFAKLVTLEVFENVEEKLKKGKVWFAYCGNLVTIEREFLALCKLKTFPLLKAILRGKSQVGARPIFGARAAPQEAGGSLPPECSGKEFQKFLKDKFNVRQYQAVCTSAHHCANPGQEGNAFTLVHGPPGTGKTHTIWGILNVVHLVCFQRYYSTITDAVKAQELGRSCSSLSRADARKLCDCLFNAEFRETRELQESQRVLKELASKPRILVCAPSNAAVDELCKRVVQNGFYDMNAKKYTPDVVRISAGEVALSTAVSKVSSREQAANFLRMPPQELEASKHFSLNQVEQLSRRIEVLVLNYKRNFKMLQATCDTEGVLEAQLKAMQQPLIDLVDLHENRDKHLIHLYRLDRTEHSRKCPQHQQRRFLRELEDSFLMEAEIVFCTLSSSAKPAFEKLKLKFQVVLIDEAAQASEIECLQPMQYGARHCVLVGDPRQLPATVISTLAAECRYDRSLLERVSLEGENGNAIQLNEQFRMHPLIRQFPSNYFYNGQLQDAPDIQQLLLSGESTIYKAIKTLGGKPAYSIVGGKEDEALLDRPYTLFHVKGMNTRNKQGSLANRDEVDVVVALYDYLMGKVGPLESSGRCHVIKHGVGVITPYRHQKDKIKDAFERKYGHVGRGSKAYNVRIDTIDSFQGKERTVVILSCVRSARQQDQKKNQDKDKEQNESKSSSKSSSIGFVSDVRRMNVAITRAKILLWIVGDIETLQLDEAWKALIEDAKTRNRIRFDTKQLVQEWKDKEDGEL